MTNHHDLANFIWSIADLLRGPYRPPQYERVMLPSTVLRRFDCVLAKTKEDVLVAHARYKVKHQSEALDMLLNKFAGQRFHNHSPLTFEKLKGDPDNIHQHLVSYIQGFSENVREIFERFEFAKLYVYGQDFNPRAVAASDLLLKEGPEERERTIVEDDKLPGTTYTEIGMNDGMKESEIPDKFASKDYQVLLVAEKYQTGFDQPLLHTMYSDLEKLYTFLRHLAPKLRKRRGGKQYNFDEEIRLEYYRLQKISEGAIGLKEGEAKPLDGPNELGSGVSRDRIALSRLIDLINDRFGTEFTEADQLFFDQIIAAAMLDEDLRQAADANPEDKFALLFGNLLQTLFIERMEQNEDIFARFMNEKEFQQLVGEWISKQVYQRLRGKQT